jgi:hypothetical protein
MNHEQWDGFDPARSRLRALVARVDAELGRFAPRSDVEALDGRVLTVNEAEERSGGGGGSRGGGGRSERLIGAVDLAAKELDVQ